MMTCIIIEDQPPAQRILKKYIEDIGTLHLKGVFSDALQAMELLKTESVDLLFLDIHLPKLSGIDFLKSVPNSPSVILTTAFSEYALESYEFNVVDYLLKPFSFQRFVKAISKVTERQHMPTSGRENAREVPYTKEVYIKSGYEHIKIVVADIHRITSDSDYTEVLTSEKKYLSSEPLRFWLETLPCPPFYRIHKPHIINSDKIEKIAGNRVYLKNGGGIALGESI